MSFQLIGDTTNLPNVVNQMNQNILELKSKEVTEIIKDETGTRRVLLGKGKDNFYGLKVSKPTFDVYEATDGQLIFNSNNNSFKIVDIIDGTITADVITESANGAYFTTATSATAHGLSFVPTIVGAIGSGTGYSPIPRPGTIQSSGGHLTEDFIFATADATNVTVTVRSKLFIFDASSHSTAANEYSYRIYLLQETAN